MSTTSRAEMLKGTVHLVAAMWGMNPAVIYSPSSARKITAARDEVIRRLADLHGWSNSEIARQLGMDQSSVWAALNRDEKRARNTAWVHKTRAEAMRGRA